MTGISNPPQELKHRLVVSSFVCKDTPEGLHVLIFKRSEKVHSYKGKWAACSGHIEETDASSLVAAERELVEETAYTSSDLEFIRAGKPFSIIDKSLSTRWTIHPFAFMLRPAATEEGKDKEPVIDWEHTEFQWVSPAEVIERGKKGETVPHLNTSLSRVIIGPTTSEAITALENDHDSGARELATNAVSYLRKVLVDPEEGGKATSAKELWDLLRISSWHFSNARPSMGAAITSAVVRALGAVREGWLKNVSILWYKMEGQKGLDRLRNNAGKKLELVINERYTGGGKLAQQFINWLEETKLSTLQEENRPLRILTLSSSLSVRDCLSTAILRFPNLCVELRVLESRPRNEGATFGSLFLSELRGQGIGPDRLNVKLAPDSHVAMMAKDIDMVLLGADRISGEGDVSNKTGSFPAVLCAKKLAGDRQVDVVILAEVDKIAKPGALEHVVEENNPEEVSESWSFKSEKESEYQDALAGGLKIHNIYFEWVPKEYVDVYVSEYGTLSREEVRQLAEKVAEMEEKVFGDL
ncbi:MAG: hypothetical protein M1834_005064 [Cirrosporium novae-zelandiae]|nr:MAG: hypothetical protein M1834_005064 [Cirrosporium novae-zelandiae]